jgi:hypothetical protein
VVAGALVAGGTALGFAAPQSFTLGGWLTGGVLLAFAGWPATARGAGLEGKDRIVPSPRGA